MVVVPLSLSRVFSPVWVLLLISWAVTSIALEPIGVDDLASPFYELGSAEDDTEGQLLLEGAAGGYLARLHTSSPVELEAALVRAEELFFSASAGGEFEPVAFVLHGPEVAVFFKDNYRQYKRIVDLAARLSAFEVLEIKVCETRMGVLGRNKSVLQPFVDTVPFGPREIDRLLDDEHYVYF